MRFFDRLGTETKKIKARVYLELARQCMSLMDYEKMIEYLNKAIELGSLDAKNVLGTCYYNGYGVVQDYGKAASILKEVAEQGHAGAQSNLALLYLNGLGTETNYKAAYLYYKKAALQGNKYAQSQLAYLYSMGIGVDRDFDQARKWLDKAIENDVGNAIILCANNYLLGTCGFEQNVKKAKEYFSKAPDDDERKQYNMQIFDGLKGRAILKIRDVSQFLGKDIDENRIGAVLMIPEQNVDIESHTLYDVKIFKRIMNKMGRILENIDTVNENRDNEFEVFMQIYTRIAKNIKYKCVQSSTEYYSAANLIGLLRGEARCCGYAEILRNMLACRGIECNIILTEGHVINQVKLGGKWYYCDLTNDTDNIMENKVPERCLLSQEEMATKTPKVVNGEVVHPSPESYPIEEIEAFMKRLKIKMELKQQGKVVDLDEYKNRKDGKPKGPQITTTITPGAHDKEYEER